MIDVAGGLRRLVEIVAPARLGTGFRWLLASAWVSNLGDGVVLAAGPLLIASQTGSAFLVALGALVQWLPPLVFGLFAGVLTDRVDRRRIVVAVNVLRCAVVGVLAVAIATGAVSIAVALVALFLLGSAEVFGDNAAGTLVPTLVQRDDLPVANARVGTAFITLNQLAGPPLGAALFAAGALWPFVSDAVLVAVAALLVARIALPERGASGTGPATARSAGRAGSEAEQGVSGTGPATEQDAAGADVETGRSAAGAGVEIERSVEATPTATPGTTIRDDIAAAVRWTWQHPAVRTLTVTLLVFNVTFGAAFSVLVLYAAQRLGLDALGFGLITTVQAAGGLLGTLLYPAITRRVSLGNLMRIGLVLETLTHAGLALTTTPWVAMVIFFVFGMHAFVWGTTSITVRQRVVPDAMRGRVNSVNTVGCYGGLVAGSGLGGLLAQQHGVTAPFWVAFAGSALFVVLVWGQLRHIAHEPAPA